MGSKLISAVGTLSTGVPDTFYAGITERSRHWPISGSNQLVSVISLFLPHQIG